MPVVRVNDATFANLSTLKAWFGTSTPGETIDLVVRQALEQLGIERDDEPGEGVATTSTGAMEFGKAPGLSFTKPMSASVDGKAVGNPNWSSILLTIIGLVKSKGLEGDRLVQELGIPAKAAQHEEDGFKYHANLGISLQGQSAADAWKEIDRLAKKWRIPVFIEFRWRQNPKAQHPGQTGIIKSGGA